VARPWRKAGQPRKGTFVVPKGGGKDPDREGVLFYNRETEWEGPFPAVKYFSEGDRIVGGGQRIGELIKKNQALKKTWRGPLSLCKRLQCWAVRERGPLPRQGERFFR